jgi:hypothetical protein
MNIEVLSFNPEKHVFSVFFCHNKFLRMPKDKNMSEFSSKLLILTFELQQ